MIYLKKDSFSICISWRFHLLLNQVIMDFREKRFYKLLVSGDFKFLWRHRDSYIPAFYFLWAKAKQSESWWPSLTKDIQTLYVGSGKTPRAEWLKEEESPT